MNKRQQKRIAEIQKIVDILTDERAGRFNLIDPADLRALAEIIYKYKYGV